jgi:hypothetical protein
VADHVERAVNLGNNDVLRRAGADLELVFQLVQVVEPRDCAASRPGVDGGQDGLDGQSIPVPPVEQGQDSDLDSPLVGEHGQS